MRRARGLVLPALAALPLLLWWPALRFGVEARMSLHMLVEFPALVAAGWAACRLSERHAGLRRVHVLQSFFDWGGLSSVTFASGVAAVWMLPSALDAALMSGGVAAAKFASWWVAGWLLAASRRRMAPEVLLFFSGNLAWMLATAGMLYLDTPARLCVNYLQDDQRHTGTGLVLLAVVLGAVALRQVLRSDGAAAPPRGAARPLS